MINQPTSPAINAEDLRIRIISHKILEILNSHFNNSFFDEDPNLLGVLTIINTNVLTNILEPSIIPQIIDCCCYFHLKEKLEKYLSTSEILDIHRQLKRVFFEENPSVTFTFRERMYSYDWLKKTYEEINE